jgi:hypothetical protein
MWLRGPEDSRFVRLLRYHLRVAESVRPPVAIRIVRPYETEDELLEHELETVGKTSVVLIGAHPRPTGVILRFEVTLASGATVLRGEGRVLAHKENAFRGQPGLTLRFTRLDPRSKSVVDRATAIRESRSAGDGGSPSRPAPRAEGALADALTASTPAPSRAGLMRNSAPPARSAPPASAPSIDEADTVASTSGSPPSMNADQEAAVASARASAREKANANARANAKRTASGRPMALTPPPVPAAPVMTHMPDEPGDPTPDDPTPVPTPVTSIPGEVREKRAKPNAARTAVPSAPMHTSAPLQVQAPPDRADLLARLRERAGKLPPERVQEILSARR